MTRRISADVSLSAARLLGTEWIVDYAARRSYWWCKPPRCGIATIGPSVGGATGRETGESLLAYGSLGSGAAYATLIEALAFLGWAYCGALMGVGRQFFSMKTTLVIHALGAPIGFGALSWVYHQSWGRSRPITTAWAFLTVVVALDVFVIAVLVERSFAMFRNVVGTWLPFTLIFVASYSAGVWASATPRARHRLEA